MAYLMIFLLTCVSAFAGNSTLLVPQSSLIEVSLPLTEEDELGVVEQLIEATEEQLKQQKQLRDLMYQLKKQREDFVQGNQTRSHATKLVRTARQIYDMITMNHLEQMFSQEYLEELLFFSSIAGKSAITRP